MQGTVTGENNLSFGLYNPSVFEANSDHQHSLTNSVLDLYALGNSGSVSTSTQATGTYLGSFTLASNGDLTFQAVPEPSTYVMLIGGVALLGLVRRRSLVTA